MGARAHFSGWIAREQYNPFRRPHVRTRPLGFRLMAGGWPLRSKALTLECGFTSWGVGR
jgi:hypothetical protein